MLHPALGLIETTGIEGGLAASKAASNAGGVVIVSTERVDGGRLVVKIEGDWKAVQAAIDSGARAADKAGQLVGLHMIPKTDSTLGALLPYTQFLDRFRTTKAGGAAKTRSAPTSKPVRPKSAVRSKPKPPQPTPAPVAKPEPIELSPLKSSVSTGTRPTWAELEAMAVVKLRKHARSVEGLPIQGRQISKANKEQLLAALWSVRGGV